MQNHPQTEKEKGSEWGWGQRGEWECRRDVRFTYIKVCGSVKPILIDHTERRGQRWWREEGQKKKKGAVWCRGVQTDGGAQSQNQSGGGSQQKEGDREKGREKRERERKKNSYFTPMQHAEEIQLPFKLHI